MECGVAFARANRRGSHRGRGEDALVLVLVLVVVVRCVRVPREDCEAAATAAASMAIERWTCSIIARVCDAAVVAWASMAGSTATPEAARACNAATADSALSYMALISARSLALAESTAARLVFERLDEDVDVETPDLRFCLRIFAAYSGSRHLF